jgi:dihydrofolate reductase
MRITLIVAAAKNGVIGKDGTLPWRIPSDLKTFKAETLGKPVIMGRKTWDSLPNRPLPGRRNIVVTRDEDFRAESATVVTSVGNALVAAAGAAEACVIGGGEIYRAFFPLADKVILTAVDVEVEGDVTFPDLPEADWQLVDRPLSEPDPRDSAPYEILIYHRRTAK